MLQQGSCSEKCVELKQERKQWSGKGHKYLRKCIKAMEWGWKGLMFVFRDVQNSTSHVSGFMGKNRDRKIKANTCDREGGAKPGKCRAGMFWVPRKQQGHAEQPDAQGVLFLDSTTDLEGSVTFTESPPPLPATPGADSKSSHLDTENSLTAQAQNNTVYFHFFFCKALLKPRRVMQQPPVQIPLPCAFHYEKVI